MGIVDTSIADETESDKDSPNLIGLSISNTQNGSSNGAGLGLVYERKFSSLIGLGVFAEFAGGDIDIQAVGAPVFFHPHAGWFFKVGPGLEFDDGETKFMVRTGVGYEFEFAPRWSVAPEFNVDFVGGETELVYGLVIGRKF